MDMQVNRETERTIGRKTDRQTDDRQTGSRVDRRGAAA
jgi:hypothetical protein